MLSCKQVSELVSESHDRHLSRGERLRVRLHLMLCKLCRRYQRQIRFIEHIGRRLAGEETPLIKPLDEAARERIRQKLEQHKKE